MSPTDRIAYESAIEDIVGRAGWMLPATRDAAGVLIFQHPRHLIQLIVRSHFGPEQRRDFVVITFPIRVTLPSSRNTEAGATSALTSAAVSS